MSQENEFNAVLESGESLDVDERESVRELSCNDKLIQRIATDLKNKVDSFSGKFNGEMTKSQLSEALLPSSERIIRLESKIEEGYATEIKDVSVFLNLAQQLALAFKAALGDRMLHDGFIEALSRPGRIRVNPDLIWDGIRTDFYGKIVKLIEEKASIAKIAEEDVDRALILIRNARVIEWKSGEWGTN